VKKRTLGTIWKKKKEKKGKLFVSIHFPVKKQEKEEKQPKEKEAEKAEKPLKNPKTISEVYQFGDELGRGGFSVVKRATNKETAEVYAIKIIEKKRTNRRGIETLTT